MKGPAERPLHVASPARRRHILRSESAKYVRCGDFVDALKGAVSPAPFLYLEELRSGIVGREDLAVVRAAGSHYVSSVLAHADPVTVAD